VSCRLEEDNTYPRLSEGIIVYRSKTNQALRGRRPIPIIASVENIGLAIASSAKNHVEIGIAFNAIFKGLYGVPWSELFQETQKLRHLILQSL
jgi:hypothetical protein